MYQLAAFLSVAALVGIANWSASRDTFTDDNSGKHTGHKPIIAAQEVVYNEMDVGLLGELGVKSVEHPEGFKMLDKHSFAFCPGAEQDVLFTTLRADPAVYLGHRLEFHRGALGCLKSETVAMEYTIYETKEQWQKQNAACAELDDIEGMLQGGTRKAKTRRIVRTEDGQGVEVDFTFDQGQCLDQWDFKIDNDWLRRRRETEELDVNVIQRYLRDKELAKVPDLDVQDYPMHDLCFHWRPQDPEREEGLGVDKDLTAKMEKNRLSEM